MEILLTKDVPGIGKAGEVKKVADGYARNYVLPRKLGVVATPNAIKQAERQRELDAKHHAQTLTEAQALAARIDAITLTFQAKAGENDRLFGSITAADIAERLEQENRIAVDKRKIDLEDSIKSLGPHRVAIRLHPNVVAHLSVNVEKE